ncbi:MAG: hypothetical protein ACK45R_06575 [Candidatus Kapaibacterium sp.]
MKKYFSIATLLFALLVLSSTAMFADFTRLGKRVAVRYHEDTGLIEIDCKAGDGVCWKLIGNTLYLMPTDNNPVEPNPQVSTDIILAPEIIVVEE